MLLRLFFFVECCWWLDWYRNRWEARGMTSGSRDPAPRYPLAPVFVGFNATNHLKSIRIDCISLKIDFFFNLKNQIN